MKKLEELDIDQAPWSVATTGIPYCLTSGDDIIATFDPSRKMAGNARLASSAQILYETLYELVEACHAVGYRECGAAEDYTEANRQLYAILDEAESALNIAADAPIEL